MSGTSVRPVEEAAVDAVVGRSMDLWEVPGAAVAVVLKDEVVYLKGLGVRERGKEDPVTPDTIFAIASTTKAITTTAIAMLVADGKMAWDDPVRKHVEFFHLSDPLADANVTIRDLCCHRTGVSRHDHLWYGVPWGREEIIRKMALVARNSSFRSRYEYQNIMYLTAGTAAGYASGGSWEELVRERIFNPLGMAGANFSATDAEKAPNHATPHMKKDDQVHVIHWRNIDTVGPAGCINAGVRDLAKWVRLQLGNGAFEGQELLSPAALADTWAPQVVVPMDEKARLIHPGTLMMSYALGWMVQDYYGRRLVSHAGGIDGFRSHVAILPEEGLGIAILSNLATSLMPEGLVKDLADLFLGLPSQDWAAQYREHDQKWEAEGRTKKEEEEAKQRQDTTPSRELQAYEGEYEEPAYEKAVVTLEDEALCLRWSSFASRLEHFHFDTFTAKADDTLQNPLDGQRVVFTLGGDGEVATMACLDVQFKKIRE